MRIWESTSEYMQIIEQLKTIYNNLPEKYYLSELNIYILKDKGMLGAVFAFHLMAHAVLFDLTRISLAGFNFPLAPAFKNAPPEFRSYCQDLCRFHAGQVSEFIRKGMAHGRAPFDDIFCADAALESAKIQIIYAATVNRTAQTVQVTRENININLAFLLTVNRGKDAPRQFVCHPLLKVIISMAETNNSRSARSSHYVTFLGFEISQKDIRKNLGELLSWQVCLTAAVRTLIREY